MTTLTTRELEVFKLVAEGHSSLERSEKLKLDHKTVDYHWAKAKKKLKVDSRAQAAHLALAQGLIKNIYSEIT